METDCSPEAFEAARQVEGSPVPLQVLEGGLQPALTRQPACQYCHYRCVIGRSVSGRENVPQQLGGQVDKRSFRRYRRPVATRIRASNIDLDCRGRNPIGGMMDLPVFRV